MRSAPCGSYTCGYTCDNPESFTVTLDPGYYILAVNLATTSEACSAPSYTTYTVDISGGGSGATLLGYNVYRSDVDSDSSYYQINGSLIPASNTDYTDYYGLDGVSYYRATAVYDIGESDWSNTAEVNTNPVTPPSVTAMQKMGSPFRIVVYGSNFQPYISVYINGVQWTQGYITGTTQITLTGGKALKARVPKHVVTGFSFVNADGGECDVTWSWP